MTGKPRLDHNIRVARLNRKRTQQHGQGNDGNVHNGSTACTHAICQYLNLVWNDQFLTLDEVNEMAEMPPNARSENGDPRGMRPSELEAFFRNTDIPMKLVFDRSFEDLLKVSERGPVFYAMRYGSAPRRKGTPTENGFARPFPPLRRGATQVGSSETRHAVVMLGFLKRENAAGQPITNVYRKEPNHGSPSRPERPPFDKIFAHQAKREYEDYHDKLGLDLYAAVTKRGFESPEG
jgi:hypothetical protein